MNLPPKTQKWDHLAVDIAKNYLQNGKRFNYFEVNAKKMINDTMIPFKPINISEYDRMRKSVSRQIYRENITWCDDKKNENEQDIVRLYMVMNLREPKWSLIVTTLPMKSFIEQNRLHVRNRNLGNLFCVTIAQKKYYHSQLLISTNFILF